jgi:hypothetical protein
MAMPRFGSLAFPNMDVEQEATFCAVAWLRNFETEEWKETCNILSPAGFFVLG